MTRLRHRLVLVAAKEIGMTRHHKAAPVTRQKQIHMATVCDRCGQRLGKHRYGDDACPNPQWKPGSSLSQWLNAVFRWPPAKDAT